MNTSEFLHHILEPNAIIEFGGLALLLFVVFAETGLFVGFLLPGDSLIFISGVLCMSKPHLLEVSFPILLVLMSLAAILGNVTGYWFGFKMGPPLFKRPDSLIFKKSYLELTRDFYNKNGGKTLILGRFLPIIRTFAPILAGIIKIDFRRFMLFNIVGAVAWIGLLSGTGYFLGTYLWVRENVGYIVIGLIIITLIPLFVTYLRRKK